MNDSTPPPPTDEVPVEVGPPPDGFEQSLESLGVELDEGDLARLRSYLQLLLEANRRMNLTAIRDPQAAWTKHVLDGLTLVAPLMSVAPGGDRLRVLDLGSGGGVPGLVLASVLPEVEVVLCEATGKKARFLEDAARSLGLARVRVAARRAEDLGHDEAFRATQDVVLARAVGSLASLVELSMPLLRVGGVLLAVKGERAPQEIEEAKRALHALHALVTATIPTPTGTIVVVEKSRTTPRIYPRPNGMPGNRPL